MIMTTWQGVVTVLMAVLGTIITRFLPFVLFPESKKPPHIIDYLGNVLPYAMTGLLVVYSLKNVNPFAGKPRHSRSDRHRRDRRAARMETQHAALDRRRHRRVYGITSACFCMIVCFVGLPKSEVSFIGIFHSCYC